MTTFQLLDQFLCHLCKKIPAQARFNQSLQTWCQNVALDIVCHMRLQKMDNLHKKRAILASTDAKTAKNRHFVSKKKTCRTDVSSHSSCTNKPNVLMHNSF